MCLTMSANCCNNWRCNLVFFEKKKWGVVNKRQRRVKNRTKFLSLSSGKEMVLPLVQRSLRSISSGGSKCRKQSYTYRLGEYLVAKILLSNQTLKNIGHSVDSRIRLYCLVEGTCHLIGNDSMVGSWWQVLTFHLFFFFSSTYWHRRLDKLM